jgi:RecB family exonuclease
MSQQKTRKISPSQLNEFYRCPYGWKLSHIDHARKQAVKSPKKDLGRNIHEIISNYYSILPQVPTAKTIKENATLCFNRYFERSLNDQIKQAKNLIDNFIKFELSRINNYIRPKLIEASLQTSEFKGIIDYFDGEKIIDWKTGAMMQLNDENLRQGKIYEILLRENGYIPKEQKVQIQFVTLKNGRVLTLPLVTEAWLMQQKRRMDYLVETGRFQKVPSPLCGYCEFQFICEFEGEKLWNIKKLNQW